MSEFDEIDDVIDCEEPHEERVVVRDAPADLVEAIRCAMQECESLPASVRVCFREFLNSLDGVSEVEETQKELIDSLRYFVSLKKEADRLKVQHQEMAKRVKSLMPVLIETMDEKRMDKTQVDGVTVYRHKQKWVKRLENVDMEMVCMALKASGYSPLVKESYSHQSLSARVREWTDAQKGTGIPESLQKLIGVSEIEDLRLRKAAKKAV